MVNRFFQHLEKGKLFGKRTKLLYIDDITDDDMVLYYFDDGSKCNQAYVAKTRETDPIHNQRAMIELASAGAMWRFERKEIHPQDSGYMVGLDGVRYEAPDPTVKFSGGPGVTETTVKEDAKDGVRIDIVPPFIPDNYVQPEDDDWLLSLHPELEDIGNEILKNGGESNNDFKPTANQQQARPTTLQQNDVPQQSVPAHNNVEQPKMNSAHKVSNTEASPISTSAIETVRSVSVNIDVDTITRNPEYKSVTLVIDGQKVEIPTDEFKKRLSLSSDEHRAAVMSAKNTIQTVSDEIVKTEDPLIKNMVEKCKRKSCKITLGMNLELPPKEVYETIKTMYEDGMGAEFVKSVIARVNQSMLIESLTSGLTAYYEKKLGSKNDDKEIV